MQGNTTYDQLKGLPESEPKWHIQQISDLHFIQLRDVTYIFPISEQAQTHVQPQVLGHK